MKTLHLSIVAGSGIAAAVILAFVLANLGLNLTLDGIAPQYVATDVIRPILKFDDKLQGCNTPRIMLLNATNRSQIIYNVSSTYHTCNDFFGTEFYAGINKDWIINKTQQYVIVGSVGTKSVEKEFLVYPNHEHSKLYTDIQILGSDTYLGYHPMNFTILVKAYGIVDGGQIPDVIIYDNNGSKIWETHVGLVLCCPAELGQINRNFTSSELGNEESQINGSPVIEKPGQYIMTVSYNGKTIEKRFIVLPYTNFILSNHNHVGALYQNDTYSGFTINYAITGDNKVLNFTLDNKSDAIIIPIHATEDGNLTVTLTPDLLNLLEKGKQENPFIVLTDGQEVKYKEELYNQNMILTIPFHSGTKQIEIIATELT